MASNPSFWIGVPNKVATYGQAIVLSATSTIYDSDNIEASLCTSKVASLNEDVNIDLADPDSFESHFEKTNQNMRSMIACNMWQVLLLEPWTKGQFGADFKDLNASNVKNDNGSWVGTAPVPLGNGAILNNWALFHISTQTNAHAPDGSDSMPTIVNGVNTDWWRIVDAMSNYEEEVQIETDELGITHEFHVPLKKEPTEFWQSWVGNDRSERFGIALISIAFGIVGSIAPLVFGLASAVFGLGITLLMMVSPIFLLFGLWSGRGEEIFLGWLSALANTVIKKIVAGLLLVLSLSFSLAIMGLISDIGFIKSFILMIIVSALLVKNKDKIFDMLADINFGGAFDPRQKANQFANVQKRAAQEVGRTVLAMAGGSVAAKNTGQSRLAGAKIGAQRQLRNRLYTSSAGMNILRQMEIAEGGEIISNHTCVTCHDPLGIGDNIETAYRDDYGNYYCVPCADEMGVENLYEVIVGGDSKKQSNVSTIANPNAVIMPEDKRTLQATQGLSSITHRDFKFTTNYRKEGDKYKWNNNDVKKRIIDNIEEVQKDYVVFKNVQMKYKSRVIPPSAPEPLHEYIDLALINLAWTDGRFDVIESTYKEAWKMWYEDNAKHVDGITSEEIEKFKKEIDATSPEITGKETARLLNNYFESILESTEKIADENLYVMRDGKLQLRDVDIEETNERLKRK